MRPETESEREQRRQASLEAYRALVDPANPPRKPYLFEHHFLASDSADTDGFMKTLEEKGFRIETFAYDPDDAERAWKIEAVKLDLLEERRVLALSDEMEETARQFEVAYDGWLTRVE